MQIWRLLEDGVAAHGKCSHTFIKIKFFFPDSLVVCRHSSGKSFSLCYLPSSLFALRILKHIPNEPTV